VSNALVYPIVLLVLSFAIVSFLLAYVVPQVVAVFESSNQALPLATRVLIGMSDLIRHYWFYALIVLGLAVWGFTRWLRAPEARLRFDRFLLPAGGRKIAARPLPQGDFRHFQHFNRQCGAGTQARISAEGYQHALKRRGRRSDRGCEKRPDQ
jgi:hypothetical protein